MSKHFIKKQVRRVRRDMRMKSAVKKKMVPFFLGVLVAVIAVGVLVYRQWNDTQKKYFDFEEPASSAMASPSPTPSEAVAPSPSDMSLTAPPSAEPEGGAGVVPTTQPQPEPVATPAVEPPTVEEQAKQVVYDAVSVLYGYQSDFLTQLGTLYETAKADYLALPEDERTPENRESIAMGYAIEGAALEAECDGLVATVLRDLTVDLEALGASTDIVDQIKADYIAQKEEKQADYLALLQ